MIRRLLKRRPDALEIARLKRENELYFETWQRLACSSNPHMATEAEAVVTMVTHIRDGHYD